MFVIRGTVADEDQNEKAERVTKWQLIITRRSYYHYYLQLLSVNFAVIPNVPYIYIPE